MSDDVDAQLAVARRREAALAGVLRAVGDAGNDLDAVLYAIANNAAVLTGLTSAAVFRDNGDVIAVYVAGPEREPEILQFAGDATAALNQVLEHRRTVVFDDQMHTDDPNQATSRRAAGEYGLRSAAYVPVPAGGPPAGLAVMKRILEPFAADEIEMLEVFAVHAGNAITNAELVRSIDERNAELAEALALQTATSEILELISEHPGDLTTVLDGVLSRAIELIGASQGVVMLRHGDLVRVEAGVGDRAIDGVGSEFSRDDTPWIVCDEPTFFEDRTVDTTFGERVAEIFRTLGVRSSAHFPLTIDGQWIGQINMSRTEVRPFDEKQAAILQTFADQAAIAIRNAGLFNDLEEALELQTATAEVLRLISEHPGNLETVLQGILAKAAELTGGEAGSVMLREANGDQRYVASYGPAMEPYIGTVIPAHESIRGQVFESEFDGVMHTDDFTAAVRGQGWYYEELAKVGRVRSHAISFITHHGEVVGSLHMYRHEVKPFSEAELQRHAAFAAQASLAISNAQLFNDLDQALERQTAMTDVLDAVSTARDDLQPVFEAVARHARRLCNAANVGLFVRDGSRLVGAGADGPEPFAMFENADEANEYLLGRAWSIDDDIPMSEACRTARPVHIRDWDDVPPDRFPDTTMRAWGRRSTLSLPLLRNSEIVGVLNISSVEPGGYTDEQLSLLEAFASQAAIAVDNARLLREIEERNADLSESLELQTATSDVLRLISAHPGDLATVLQGIAERAAALCDAETGSVLLRHGDILRIEAETAPVLGMNSILGREFVAERTINRRARDAHEPVFLDDFQQVRDSVGMDVARDLPHLHSFASVALMLEDEWIGNLNLTRTEVRPFDRKIAPIMQAFADQAAIAVANAKLFNDLDAALERQTAMSDVLEAVSTARFDIQPVFDRIVEHAQRLCHDVFAYVTLRDADVTVVAAAGQDTIELHPQFENRPVPVDTNSTTGTVYTTGEPLHIRDWEEVPPDLYPNTRARQMGARSLLTLPMGRHGHVIGSIGFFRVAPGGYTDDEISLLQTFTDQAAIAVDNARLLREIEERNSDLAESLELQTATSEVLQLISSNPGELTVVLEGIITRAAALCDAETGLLWLKHGNELRCEAEVRGQGVSFVGDVWDAREKNLYSVSARRARPIYNDDIMSEWGDDIPEKNVKSAVKSLVTIPLFHDGEWIGNINLGRREVRPFDQKQATILQAFADQAAIAVANAKLFNDLDAALERQTAMTEVLDAVSQARLDPTRATSMPSSRAS